MAKVLTGLTALLACLLLFPAASGRAATHPVHAIGSAGALLRKLFNPDPGGYNYLSDQFGWSVALSGTTAVIGARDVYSNSGAGAAYIYVKGATSWPRHATVTLADPRSDRQRRRLLLRQGQHRLAGHAHGLGCAPPVRRAPRLRLVGSGVRRDGSRRHHGRQQRRRDDRHLPGLRLPGHARRAQPDMRWQSQASDRGYR